MKTALFIGRFQPIHSGHLDAIESITKKYDLIKIGIGSSQESGTDKNPYTAKDREKMIKAALAEANISSKKYKIYLIPDINNPPKWEEHVRKIVGQYDTLFTGSQFVADCMGNSHTIIITKNLDICASQIRKNLRENKPWENLVPKSVEKFLKK